MLKTSPGPAERDLPYLQWIAVCKRCYRTLRLMAKSMHINSKVRRKGICYVTSHVAMRFLFKVLVKDAWAVTAVEPETSTAGTRTWRTRLSLSRLSREAGVHQSVSTPARRVPFPPGSDCNWCSSSADPVAKSIDKCSQRVSRSHDKD